MKEKIKKLLALMNKNKVIIIIALIVIGLFYWYDLRPIKIRKECLKAMGENPTFASKNQVGKYRACLIKKGLEW
jgi:hypothetical protein